MIIISRFFHIVYFVFQPYKCGWSMVIWRVGMDQFNPALWLRSEGIRTKRQDLYIRCYYFFHLIETSIQRRVKYCDLFNECAKWLLNNFLDYIESLNDPFRKLRDFGFRRVDGVKWIDFGVFSKIDTWKNVYNGVFVSLSYNPIRLK